jgi:hypothetical protein
VETAQAAGGKKNMQQWAKTINSTKLYLSVRHFTVSQAFFHIIQDASSGTSNPMAVILR